MRRDPFGERPLYFVERHGAVHAAGSVRALLETIGASPRIDPAAAVAALCGCLAPDRSLFVGVRRVPPGHELVAGEHGAVLRPWWTPPEPTPTEATSDVPSLHEELLRRLRGAVARRTSDGARACSLSDGMDSAGVLALMAERGGAGAVRAYTLADAFDAGEGTRRAGDLAARLGARHVEVGVREEELAEHFPQTVRACEDLVWNGAAVARHLFFRRVRAAGEPALLSGTGADEILCGNPAGLRSFAGHRDGIARVARSLLTAEAQGLAPPAAPGAPAEEPAPPDRPPWIVLQAAFLRTVLPDSTLVPECRTSAAEGIDVRLPYLDPDVADLCLRLPQDLRVRGEVGKVLLRDAYRGLLPEELLGRPKVARLAPAAGRGAAARDAWRGLYDRWLTAERLDPLALFEAARVRELVDEVARPGTDDARRALGDAVLLRVASLAVLADALNAPGAGPRER